LKGNRTATPTLTGPFARLSKVWRFAFLSLLIDIVAASYLGTSLPPEQAQALAALCAVVTIPFLNQQRVSRSLAAMRRWQNGPRRNGSRSTTPLIGFVIAVLIGAKLILLPTINNIASLLVAGIILLGIISSIRHVVSEARTRSRSLARTPSLHVVLWEQQLVGLFCIPIVAARLVSLWGALSLGTTAQPAANISLLVISVVLLLALKPHRSSFIGWCPNCKSPTPIAFIEYGSCPQCDEHLKQHK
jgi:hypothetical protein